MEKVENTGARNLVPTPWACCLHADIPILYILVTHYLTHFIGQPRLAKVDSGSIFPFGVLMWVFTNERNLFKFIDITGPAPSANSLDLNLGPSICFEMVECVHFSQIMGFVGDVTCFAQMQGDNFVGRTFSETIENKLIWSVMYRFQGRINGWIVSIVDQILILKWYPLITTSGMVVVNSRTAGFVDNELAFRN